MSNTIMQSLTFITFIVSQKIAALKFLGHTSWLAGQTITDHYIRSVFVSQKNETY